MGPTPHPRQTCAWLDAAGGGVLIRIALGATIDTMTSRLKQQHRVFKSAWFAKAVRKARISDDELCQAIQQVLIGQCDDLGGGVYKKRLSKNQYRSIILSRSGTYWIFEYIFAKNDRANIDSGDLNDFRKLAKAYAELSTSKIDGLVVRGDLVEICDEE